MSNDVGVCLYSMGLIQPVPFFFYFPVGERVRFAGRQDGVLVG